ncbi:AAA family ATPase [Saltatorellus ferox]|uniref:bifunctional aminoglycoside phosphotransferase/ATP-binding protein n=1 Tax=Saltatorellus ferox TaxID=2528018 RepID=UPI003AF34C17
MNTDELLKGLREPGCYPGDAETVEIIQTHLSIVCLAGDRVYKLKKAITLPFVDFAPLKARRKACRDEVRLNRRLCPQMYLGTSAVRMEDGQLQIAELGDDEGPGDLDVAVVMARLPQGRMLDELAAAGTVTDDEIRELARVVAAFHRDADGGAEVRELGAPDKLIGFADANFEELQEIADHGLPQELLAELRGASGRAFARILPELRERAASGRVVDGHGDLHTRNVCMTDPATIYDCIEFEPAFRCGDVVTEVAFLAMDLRHRGAAELARTFVDAYVDHSGDARLPVLLPQLCSYRAMIRGKVAALTATEKEVSDGVREAARRSARRHLILACTCTIESQGPWWLLVSGPPASGKSSLCRELRDVSQWPHLATDVVRKGLAGLEPTEHASAEHYSAAFSEQTYGELLRLAAASTESGRPCVLLDGNFPTPEHRARAADAARSAGARLAILHVDIDAETAARRARDRRQEPGNVSDADPSIARTLHASYLPPTPGEVDELLEFDGTKAVSVLCEAALAGLLARTD